MPHHSPANREDELNLFDRMIAGQTRERILLLEADGGFGKTTLLKEFVHRCPDHILETLQSERSNFPGLAEVLALLREAQEGLK